MQTQDHAYRSPHVVRFLRLLLRKIHGKLLVIWDGAPIHRGQLIKEFLRNGAAKRLYLDLSPTWPMANGNWELVRTMGRWAMG